jgi:hypothetical protein
MGQARVNDRHSERVLQESIQESPFNVRTIAVLIFLDVLRFALEARIAELSSGAFRDKP